MFQLDIIVKYITFGYITTVLWCYINTYITVSHIKLLITFSLQHTDHIKQQPKPYITQVNTHGEWQSRLNAHSLTTNSSRTNTVLNSCGIYTCAISHNFCVNICVFMHTSMLSCCDQHYLYFPTTSIYIVCVYMSASYRALITMHMIEKPHN